MTLDEISQMPHLGARVHLARQVLEKVQSKYRVVYEDPANPDEEAKILVPDPNWLASALAGGVLPPIEAYLEDKKKEESWMFKFGSVLGKSFAWSLVGGASHPYAEPIGPMTEEEAIEYLIQKDVPNRVWADHQTTNRPRFKIVHATSIPSHREYRGAWELNTEGETYA